MAQPTQKQNKADDAVQHNHQDGEHRVAPECRSGLATKRHRIDQHDLNDHYRERENERPRRSPRISARWSASLTTPNAHQRMTAKSQRKSKAAQSSSDPVANGCRIRKTTPPSTMQWRGARPDLLLSPHSPLPPACYVNLLLLCRASDVKRTRSAPLKVHHHQNTASHSAIGDSVS
jgi:hypothetical protein